MCALACDARMVRVTKIRVCCVYAVYLLCICCVFAVYLLCICCVFALYLLCICCVGAVCADGRECVFQTSAGRSMRRGQGVAHANVPHVVCFACGRAQDASAT